MRDLQAGAATGCGQYSFTEDEIIDFARRHDPQDFHIDASATKHSLFDGLTASGIQSASAVRKAVLRNVFADVRLLGYPQVLDFRMHKPVYPDMPVLLRHQVAKLEQLPGTAGAMLMEGLTEGRTGEGVLICEMRDLNWVGIDDATPAAQAATMDALRAHNAPTSDGWRIDDIRSSGHLAALKPGARIYYEDCHPGDTLDSTPFIVTTEDVEVFRRHFDTVQYRNEWLAPSFCIPLHADVFWLRAENTGGPGLQDVRMFDTVEAGDILTGSLRIVAVRPLRSRPTLGAVSTETFAWNQHGQPVFSLRTTSFMRRREQA